MEGESMSRELQSLLESIRSTQVLEDRVSLISQIRSTYQTNSSDFTLLIECLVTCWEDSTCFNVSYCMLNKAVLCVAAKYLESDISKVLCQYLILGTKASRWCQKYLQLAFVSTDGARDDDHFGLFCQLILDALNFNSANIFALIQSPALGERTMMLIIENFVSELLNLTKALIFDVKKIHLVATEVLKAAQMILDAATKLCRAYFQAIKRDAMEVSINRGKESQYDSEVDYASHVFTITANTIESLYKLGIFAASGGGKLVTVLNVSWKGVVSLLQLDKVALAERLHIEDIILSLVLLAIQTLQNAAKGWSSTMKETLAVSEAKRAFLPIKFYLINALRISSEYSHKAVNIYREISRCVLLISSFGILLSKENHLRGASEALIEFLEPTSFLLLHTLLNSADVRLESKIQILEWLSLFASDSSSMDLERDADTSKDSFSTIFSVNCDVAPKSEVLMLGRVILFMNLLKSSATLKDEMVLEICKKLNFLMNSLIHEDVYPSILSLHTPVLCASGPVPGMTWQPIYSCILHSLKTFLIVASSYKLAWMELETFLFENLCHPHFLYLDIIKELLSFVIRHSELDMIGSILERLCILFKVIALSQPDLTPHCSLRRMARSICFLLNGIRSAAVDQAYTLMTNDGQSYTSSIMLTALLLEGFPLNLLSDNLKASAIRKITTSFYGFIESNSKELRLNDSSGHSDSLGLPVHALSSVLRSSRIKSSEIICDQNITQVLMFAVSLIHGYKNAAIIMQQHYATVLAAVLDVISTLKQPYISDELRELILDLQTLFVTSSDVVLYRCRPSLISFLGSISHLEIADDESSNIYSSILSLYHVLLRERHWAFNHLAIGAFANFAASTSCSQLWKFIPDDAALSFDTETGKEVNESRFMDELKAFLEKEAALQDATASNEQVHHLVKEGMVLRKLSKIPDKVTVVPKNETMKNIDDKHTKKKKRKLPDGVCEGMELLQSGLKAMNNALSQADCAEFIDIFSSHLSSLKDVISHLLFLCGDIQERFGDWLQRLHMFDTIYKLYTPCDYNSESH